jgi:hypothetical protein
MRTSLLVLAAALLALPAAAQPDSRSAGPQALESGDVVFGQITTNSPFFVDQGDNLHYEFYTYDAQALEHVTFSARSLDFPPALYVSDGPGLNPELPNMELSRDGEQVTLHFYAPQMGTYTFAVVANAPSATGMFQARLDAEPPLDYATLYPGGGDPSERYALLVGVNDYPSWDADLSGTINDVTRMQRLLIEQYAFLPENVLVLSDASATREHVIEAFRRHLGQAGPSGAAVFYYSGHGTQVPDGFQGYDASDEADKADEALVLWGVGGAFGLLVDEELGGLADNLAAGHRLVVLDNCNSGTGTRAAGEEALYAVRTIDLTRVRAPVDVPDALVAEATTRGADDDAGPAGHVLLAAARADQFAIESNGLDESGQSGGIFTYYLVKALRETDPSQPLSTVMARVTGEVMQTTEALKYEEQLEPQEPQAEGTRVGDPISAFFLR